MSALAPVEAAIFARLLTLQHAGTPSPTQPFALVARYAGPVTRDGLESVCGQYPCLLMKRGRARPQIVGETVLRSVEQRSGDEWTLLIVIEEGREIDDAMQGSMPDVPGLLPLHDVVERCVNALHVTGLWTDRPVLITGYGDLDVMTTRGVAYAEYIEIRADRSMEQAPSDDPASQPFEGADGGVRAPTPAPAVPYTADTTP